MARRQKSRKPPAGVGSNSDAKPSLAARLGPWVHVLNSLLSFALGVSVWISDKFFFLGLNIEPPRSWTQILPKQTGPRRQELSYGFQLKVVNAMKDSTLIEKIEAHSFETEGLRFNFTSAIVVTEGEKPANKFEAFQPRLGPLEAQLPLIVKSGTTQFLVTTLFFQVEGSGKSLESVKEALITYTSGHGIDLDVGINGKLRAYPLKTRPFGT